MSLHQKITEELDRLDPHRLTKLGKAVGVVVGLHAPVQQPLGGGYVGSECKGCDQGLYVEPAPRSPCSTISAIAHGLGIETGEDRG